MASSFSLAQTKTNMKRIVADALANYLADNVVGLAGKVSATKAGPETTAPCLALKVLPDSFVFQPSQAGEVYEEDDTLVLDVGSFEGIFTLQLFTVNASERETYEQRILDVFFEDTWAPGTLFIDTPNLTIRGATTLYQAEIKVRLENEEWNDELAFEAKRYTFLEVFIDFPALTSQQVSDIESLQVCLADVDAEIVSIADIDDDDRVEVQEDGTTLKGTV